LITGGFGPVRNCSQNVFASETRILGQQLGFRHSAGQKIKNQRNPDARTPDAGLAAAYGRIDADTVKELYHPVNLAEISVGENVAGTGMPPESHAAHLGSIFSDAEQSNHCGLKSIATPLMQ
jgi:hypothetical protein